ncbi:MAG: DNA topoisomerase 3 [Prevotella sp.]|nr:DNA topoisomerase 3 [Prevotella sp.]
MITIIAEKPSVARQISRVVGAMERKVGYYGGNNYCVTWAFGHLIQLAMPEAYGVTGFRRESLPIIPNVFQLVSRKDAKGKEDDGVKEQLRVIKNLFEHTEKIIVATDAGREGELIFRYLYQYLDCHVPFQRLWISSLTDKAIKEGLKNLKDGHDFDNLFLSAKARSEADWLVGINGTQALTIAAGRGTYSLGRVQTPTLAMVCHRFLENKNFKPTQFWQMHFTTEGDGKAVKFQTTERWNDKTTAENLYQLLKGNKSVVISKVECKEKTEEPPLLYDLTALQKDANVRYGFTAEQTLAIAQKLYEAKAITYPRTSSRYIPDDVYDEIPKLLRTLQDNEQWGALSMTIRKPNTRSVDASKVTDHHALLITGEKLEHPSNDDKKIYNMIVARMLEAFSDKCEKQQTTVNVEVDGVQFVTKGTVIMKAGWRFIQNEETNNDRLPNWKEGQTLPISGWGLAEGKTKPVPIHTEATLLSEMESCGKGINDEELAQAIKECGIGTPATRANIIETLINREYMIRLNKQLIPTEKGLFIYDLLKDKQIADVAMTGQWEQALARIERGEYSADDFRKGIEDYTTSIVQELLSLENKFEHSGIGIPCPKCGKGTMQFYKKVVKCDNPACDCHVFREKAGKVLTDAQLKDLLTEGRTGLIKGFKSKQGNSFDAVVTLNHETYQTEFSFPERKKTSKKPLSRK